MPKDRDSNSLNKGFDFNSNQRLYAIISSVLVAAFVLLFYAFPGYSPEIGSDGPVEIAFADNISQAHQEVIDLFNKEHKGRIKVVPVNLPFSRFSTDDRKELLSRYFRSKSDRIDVFAVDQIWVPRFARWGVTLDKLVPDAEIDSLSNYATRSCYLKGRLIAAPLYLDIAVMFYRRDLLQTLPDADYWANRLKHSLTWDEMFKLHSKLGANTGPFFVYQADDYEGLVCMYTELLANLNKQIVEKGVLQLETPEAVKALQFLVDLGDKYHLSPNEVTGFREDNSYDFFLRHKGMFVRAWPGFARDTKLREEFPTAYSECYPSPLPHLSGSSPAYVFGGWNLMISKFSTKIPEAVEFVRFLLGKQSQEIMYEVGGYLPSNTLVYSDTSFVKKHPELLFYENLFKHGVYRPFSDRYTGISDVLSYYLNLAIRREMSPKEALKRATDAIDSGSILIK